MRNRESAIRKIEQIENSFNRLILAINRGTRDDAQSIIEESKEKLDQLKLYIESEPISDNELNKF